jgi:hypothetical protein
MIKYMAVAELSTRALKTSKWSNDVTFMYDDGTTLACPHCHEGNLHHRHVTVYDRDEDDDNTYVVSIDRQRTPEPNSDWYPEITVQHLPSNYTENPSSRRNGLSIAFECEHCYAVLELTITQHKGASLMSWRYYLSEPE